MFSFALRAGCRYEGCWPPSPSTLSCAGASGFNGTRSSHWAETGNPPTPPRANFVWETVTGPRGPPGADSLGPVSFRTRCLRVHRCPPSFLVGKRKLARISYPTLLPLWPAFEELEFQPHAHAKKFPGCTST